MASQVSIYNLALQLLGANRVSAIDQDHRNARACTNCYEELRDAEIRKHRWGFARVQVQLAADATAPTFDFSSAFTLPADCLRVLPPNRRGLDWTIHDSKIYTNEGAPLDVTYLARKTDPNSYPSTFRIALAAKMAEFMCEELTQSNTKIETAKTAYKQAISDARKANDYENTSAEAPLDDWDAARLAGAGVGRANTFSGM